MIHHANHIVYLTQAADVCRGREEYKKLTPIELEDLIKTTGFIHNRTYNRKGQRRAHNPW